jgi:hypothetical protein
MQNEQSGKFLSKEKSMPDQTPDLRQRLLNIQEVSPPLRSAYEQELDKLLQPSITRRSGALGTILAMGLLVTVALIIRADVYHSVHGLMLAGHLTLVAGFVAAAMLIFRDLYRRKHSRGSVLSVASLLTGTAGALTVVALILGLRAPSDPKSLFGAFYVFVFYFACAIWAIESRIAAAELANREQSLRIECRLADLAERIQK